MRKFTVLLVQVMLAACVSTSSCIKKEALNPEADITKCLIDSDILRTEPTIKNTSILILLNGKADITRLAPEFELTPGATITPASGTVRDFTHSQTYKVLSQDGKWEKSYTVTATNAEIPTHFDFEHWMGIPIGKNGMYEIPYEPVVVDGWNEPLKMEIWSCGNAGYGIVKSGMPQDFPTAMTENSQSGGSAAKLVTMTTGYRPMPMAAGNLFLGEFDGSKAMANALEATRFGIPFGKKPLKFKGYYKYKPGDVFCQQNNNFTGGLEPIEGRVDECQIYSVLYEIGDSGEKLHGGNVLTDPRLIAVAKATTPRTDHDNDYHYFEVDFDYDSYPTVFDAAKLADYKYYIGIVFSASADGARFSGAEGSTLFVDNISLICEGDQEVTF